MRFPFATFPVRPDAAFPTRIAIARPVTSILLEKNGRSIYTAFCSTLEHLGMGLLGQDGFFSRFDVAVRHRSSFFEIIP
jgi:hypothetical protein